MHRVVFAIIALMGALLITRCTVAQPSYTDSFYYFNAANRLVSGHGLTDAYLWNYFNAPNSLPAASHRYWMPLASLCAALGMWLLSAPGNFAAAQIPFALMYAALVYIGFWLGERLGGTRRHAWVAGLLTLFSGFFVRFWGETSTFAPYGLAGALCLLFLTSSFFASEMWQNSRLQMFRFLLAGICAGFGHLARADGILLLLVGFVVILWSARHDKQPLRHTLRMAAGLTIGYLLVMTPWFVRNLNEIGAPLPAGGLQGIWFREYNDIFSYPPDASPQTFFANGIGILFESRWTALQWNFARFIAEQGMLVLAPLLLIGLWRRWRELLAVTLYALGLFIVMTFVFPFPGMRGGLFHSAAALVPWWAALAVMGLDDAVDWIARQRKHWNAPTAKRIFSGGLVLIAIVLSLMVAKPATTETPAMYLELQQILPPNARVMVNDPAALYYFTGFGGVVLPNEAPNVIPEIAQRYHVNYLLLEYVDGVPAVPQPLIFDPNTPPSFLVEIPLSTPNVRLYEIRP
jgi:4-amino-4-deoxy-L-arabinose transferase-like glycosyltransferase